MEPSDTGVHSISKGSSPSTGVVFVGEAANDMIVSVHRHEGSSGYIFRCSFVGCRNTTFRRWHDFERHDNTFHNGTSVLWCPAYGCSRSKGHMNKSFPKARKDKLREHVRKVHGYDFHG
ncbi:hypothetical protein FB567DRAFT_530873 [Paraphoma chrysanthemicola]|uniref:C2H2-type domain-containing protein n=1 Tax=Paraphoma chrysanthemicola TaxID=798071 RepID=A0A8K0R2P2_9PLEO|nr:hypothetical protein FB567DRAFT_530873 [Paraphoma chrysanthemicola]